MLTSIEYVFDFNQTSYIQLFVKVHLLINKIFTLLIVTEIGNIYFVSTFNALIATLYLCIHAVDDLVVHSFKSQGSQRKDCPIELSRGSF